MGGVPEVLPPHMLVLAEPDATSLEAAVAKALGHTPRIKLQRYNLIIRHVPQHDLVLELAPCLTSISGHDALSLELFEAHLFQKFVPLSESRTIEFAKTAMLF